MGVIGHACCASACSTGGGCLRPGLSPQVKKDFVSTQRKVFVRQGRVAMVIDILAWRLRETSLSPVDFAPPISWLDFDWKALDSPHFFGRATKGVSRVSVGRCCWMVCTLCSAWSTAALLAKKYR